MSNPNLDHAARLEDLTWMADTGETIDGAARRLGITTTALHKWAQRHGHTHLIDQLNHNNNRNREYAA